jgi:NADH dehydrogenase [ubiquinone] 1 alpha subcomplex assembly factor 1
MSSRTLFDFSVPTATAGWFAVDDNVMGGGSLSHLRYHPEAYAVFEGALTVQNNAGFASVRCEPFEPDLESDVDFLLEVKGDGRRYKLILRSQNSPEGMNYHAEFVTTGNWETVRIPGAAFVPKMRGRQVADAAEFDSSKVNQAGLMLADAKQGDFSLAIRRLWAEGQVDASKVKPLI